jgi:RNA polymerase sigma factor (sigma-70 family)
MTTIAVRKAIRHVKLRYQFVQLDELTDQQLLSVDSDSFSAEDLQKSIDSLPSGYRVVFTLIEIEGYNHKEVADILNISEGTSKSQLFHAKKALRKMLQKDYSYGKF